MVVLVAGFPMYFPTPSPRHADTDEDGKAGPSTAAAAPAAAPAAGCGLECHPFRSVNCASRCSLCTSLSGTDACRCCALVATVRFDKSTCRASCRSLIKLSSAVVASSNGLLYTSVLRMRTSPLGLSVFSSRASCSRRSSAATPPTTLAKMVWTLSRWRHARKHTKNWALLLFFPPLAMLTIPFPPCTSLESNSSLKGHPEAAAADPHRVSLSTSGSKAHSDSPPRPSPLVVSPPCNMNPGMRRWNATPS
mmetsp:Transcript_52824/g.98153  ORF Transcript_52824/g.98153 Transcript_52824/m.98153 type:complete len:250 (+) Transcript_52824:265-1014(+)